MKIRMFQLRKLIREAIANAKNEEATPPGKNIGNSSGPASEEDLEMLANRGDSSVFISDELSDNAEENDE